MRSGNDERVRGTAAQALLDRGWGKPKVEVVADGATSYIEALRLINEQIVTDHTASKGAETSLRTGPKQVLELPCASQSRQKASRPHLQRLWLVLSHLCW